MNAVRKMAPDNIVHPTALIDPTAQLGRGNFIGPYCSIGPHVVIGDNNRFEAFCSIGSPPELKGYFHQTGKGVMIGHDNVFREHVSVQSGSEFFTVIGNDSFFLTGSYVAHDCVIENKVTLSGGARLAGKCVVQEGANLGLNVSVHQYSVIGAYAMIGMGSVITKKTKITPFGTFVGVPAGWIKTNQVAIERNGLTLAQQTQFQEEFKSLWSLPVADRLQK